MEVTESQRVGAEQVLASVGCAGNDSAFEVGVTAHHATAGDDAAGVPDVIVSTAHDDATSLPGAAPATRGRGNALNF